MAVPGKNQTKISLAASDFARIWTIVRKNWWIVILFAGLSYGGAEIYNYKQPEIYGISNQLLLKSNDQLNTSSLISDNSSYYGNTYRTYVDNSNEMRVIKSYDLVSKAIQRLDFQVSYYIVGRIRMKEEYNGLPFVINYSAISPEYFEQMMDFSILNINEFSFTYTRGEERITKKGFFDKDYIDPEDGFHFMVRRNPILTVKTVGGFVNVKYIIQFHSHQQVVQKYLSSLNVSNPEYTNILQVSVSDEIPQRAVKFIDTLAAVYIENSVMSRLDVNKNTLFYIERQMDQVTEMLKSIEDSIDIFKDRNAILDLDLEEEDYFNKLSKYDDNKRKLMFKDSMLSDLRNYIITNKDSQFLPPSAYVIDDEFIKKTSAELFQKQMDYNQALVASTPENFAVKSFRKNINDLKKDLLVYISNAHKALVEQKGTVDQHIRMYFDSIRALSPKERGLLERKREHTVNESMYLFLLQKKANAIIARAGIIPDVRIIETARPTGLISPNKSKNLYAFLSIGLVLAAAIILVRVIFFARIEQLEELKALTPYPIVGEVILSQESTDSLIAVESAPKSPVTEAFRAMRTNLQYMSLSPGCKVIIITSNNPGEGKTFCSINLAAILAKAGKRVLLIELDLHKPRIHKGLNLNSDIGISTFAIGKNTLEECINNTTVENLQVLLSGPLPPNPSEMVLSSKVEEIFAYSREHYDYVIVDTPPVGLISDAFFLMQKGDVSLFVIHTRFNYRPSLSNAHEIVDVSKIKNFAFILNGVKRKRSRYYYNRYNYYNYNYNYGGYSGYGTYGSYGSYGETRPRSKKSKK